MPARSVFPISVLITMVVGLSSLAGLAVSRPVSAAQATVATDGDKIYEAYCMSCHGKGGRGDGPGAQSLNRLVPDLTRLTPAGGTFDRKAVGRSIRDHVMSDKMRRWGETFMNVYSSRGLADLAIDNLAGHLESIQAPPAR